MCSFFIDILAFEQTNSARGWGFCFVFSTRGPEFCNEKLSPRREFSRKKLVTGGQPGGMVTGQIDTCITLSMLLKRVDLESFQNPYRSLKDFGTVGETKEKCGKGKRLIITDAITAEGDLSKMHCGYLKHQKHLRKKVSKGVKSIRKKCPKDAEEDKKHVDDDGAILMFEEDYHDSMNAEAYESWFE